MHKDAFITKWVVAINTRMVGMCQEGFVIPIIALFYNDAATANILKCKRDARMQAVAFAKELHAVQQLRWYCVASRIRGYMRVLWKRILSKISIWQLQPPAEDVQRCVERPEFQVLTYLHKLTQRMSSWRSFLGKRPDFEHLPAEYRITQGPTDPPHAEYSHLVRVQELIDAYIPKELQTTMLAVLVAEKCTHARQLEPSHREYGPLVICIFIEL